MLSDRLRRLTLKQPHLSEDQNPIPTTDQEMPDGQLPSHSQVRSLHRDSSWQVATNIWTSFRYASSGIVYAFATQRNFRIHVIIGTAAIALGTVLRLSRVEMTAIAITIGFVLAMELLNTAIESVVDLAVKQSYHELARIAKDCAAGAVLVSSLAAVTVAGYLLLPPLVALVWHNI
jgi:diacylglycerol kinase (ATP)